MTGRRRITTAAALEQRLRSYEPLWDSWYISGQLFCGANSSVFLLERKRQEETLFCALKVVELVPRDDSDLTDRLETALQEIRRMERLRDCPYVVVLQDDMILERLDGGYDVLLRMEYLDCLETMMREETLPWNTVKERHRQVAALAGDLCRALICAHDQGILHRDIKPANIYRQRMEGLGGVKSQGDGRLLWKLGDFGASRQLELGAVPATITGTTAYMAPEIGRGEEWGPWSDIYSLGIVLYQLLNDGFLPLTDETSGMAERERSILRRWNGEELPLPSDLKKKESDPGDGICREDARFAEGLGAIVAKACCRRPEERYRSAGEMLLALEALDDPDGSMETNRSAIQAASKAAGQGRRRTALFLSAALAIGGLAFSAGWIAGNRAGQESAAVATRDGHRYEVITRKATWESAKVYCESQGGHLATITSREEEELIVELLEQTDVTIAWLGADNRNSSGGFRWITGEEFEYASWGIGEPNNTGGQEHCLMLTKSATQGWVWNDAPDNGHDFYKLKEIGFVCEWE